MRLVVDASVAFKWFVTESDSRSAASLLDGKRTLISPELVLAEILNAMWKGLRQRVVDRDQFRHTATHVASFFDDLVPLRALAIRAAHIAQTLGHPVYDCFYLALAEREAAPLVTADRRLLTRLNGTAWQAHARDLASLAQDL